MRVLEAPNYAPMHWHEISIFLGGGITGCPDWQKDITKLIDNKLMIPTDCRTVLFNPRRATFDITDPSASEIQITWEHHHLTRADAILFWFPSETMCPITLLEIGKVMMMTDKELFVGCHPDYQRKFDVEFQLKLELGKRIKVVDSLDALADQTVNWLKSEFRL